jgi:hypothetical protein
VDEYLTETEQWEWVKGQVRENAPAVILTLGVMLAGVAGWRWWQQHQDSERLQAGASYMHMVQALERGDRSQAMVVLGQLEREHAKSPYTDQARSLAARLYVEGNGRQGGGELAAVVEHSQGSGAGHGRARTSGARADRPGQAGGGARDAPPATWAPLPGASGRCAVMPTTPRRDKAAALREYRAPASAAAAAARRSWI